MMSPGWPKVAFRADGGHSRDREQTAGFDAHRTFGATTTTSEIATLVADPTRSCSQRPIPDRPPTDRTFL
jgi:hypothetical protein